MVLQGRQRGYRSYQPRQNRCQHRHASEKMRCCLREKRRGDGLHVARTSALALPHVPALLQPRKPSPGRLSAKRHFPGLITILPHAFADCRHLPSDIAHDVLLAFAAKRVDSGCRRSPVLGLEALVRSSWHRLPYALPLRCLQ